MPPAIDAALDIHRLEEELEDANTYADSLERQLDEADERIRSLEEFVEAIATSWPCDCEPGDEGEATITCYRCRARDLVR